METKSPSRREALKQYKQAMVPAGVYLIRNLASGRVLVGGSMNLAGAMNRHRFELERGMHRNKELLRDWKALGAEGFSFEPIETIKPRTDPAFDYEAELEVMLKLWCEEYDCFGEKGYNGG